MVSRSNDPLIQLAPKISSIELTAWRDGHRLDYLRWYNLIGIDKTEGIGLDYIVGVRAHLTDIDRLLDFQSHGYDLKLQLVVNTRSIMLRNVIVNAAINSDLYLIGELSEPLIAILDEPSSLNRFAKFSTEFLE